MLAIKTIPIVIMLVLLNYITKGQTKSIDNQQAKSKLAINNTKLFKADNPYFQYTGRIDFSNVATPRFWSPGVYIQAGFVGSTCEIVINDEVLWGKSHNYIEIAIDNLKPFRIQTKDKTNTIKVAEGLPNGKHVITICKDTESGIGFLEFVGLKAENLYKPPPKPTRKIEFIGNSITCGMGSDLSETLCDKGEWYNQHNAYFSYGPTTARALNAQWQLTAVSGIGLIHSCCDMTITMPDVFDKINLRTDSIAWDFKKYQPDVVTVCLGQNDGIQDSTKFCNAYVSFINRLRSYYPSATIICLTSPMADENLARVMKNYLQSITEYCNKKGDKNIYKYFFSKQYHNGCGGHPDLNEHRQIAAELTAYIKKVKGW